MRLDERLDARTVRWILDNVAWIHQDVSESPLVDSDRSGGRRRRRRRARPNRTASCV
ncbi:hypothetical protein [Streptomyces sp. AN091965]|uniref:hypothetical protein n=1 Tax=Streptomyces sp. AN091965 TaxID=2927803 RepID=UPI001F605DC4|nr:hypothetical protein [Streptomyces sp. AN091965]MCI3935278.1 hypothetical protein [Streptomyces sp. AN091965]